MRFKDLIENPVLNHTTVFQPYNWPDDVQDLASYGEDSVQELFRFYHLPLTAAGKVEAKALLQWTELACLPSCLLSCLPIHGKKHLLCGHISSSRTVSKNNLQTYWLWCRSACWYQRTQQTVNEALASWAGSKMIGGADWVCTTAHLMTISLHDVSQEDFCPANSIATWNALKPGRNKWNHWF